MKTLPSCLCILGLAAGSAMGGSSILMDQIGLDDGASIDPANVLANQYFEASFSGYDVGVIDDFANANGLSGSSMQMVVGGWNGYVSSAGITGLQANSYLTQDSGSSSLEGDVGHEDQAGTPVSDPTGHLLRTNSLACHSQCQWRITPALVSAA